MGSTSGSPTAQTSTAGIDIDSLAQFAQSYGTHSGHQSVQSIICSFDRFDWFSRFGSGVAPLDKNNDDDSDDEQKDDDDNDDDDGDGGGGDDDDAEQTKTNARMLQNSVKTVRKQSEHALTEKGSKPL